MARVRALACGLVAAGLLSGMLGATPAQPEPARHGDDVVLAVDLHVHSFPGDGALAPWDLAREAQRRGLDAIALTNHNQMLSWRLARLVPWSSSGAILIPAEELTASWYHLAAVGIETPVASWRQSAAAAAAEIHARGGAAIAAHPFGDSAQGLDATAIDALDGVEVAHPLVYVFRDGRRDLTAFYEHAKIRRPSIAAIGSTDYHTFAPIGLCRTYVFAHERSAVGIVEAIRRGATVACDGTGHTYGPRDLSAAVADVCRAAAGAKPVTSTWTDPFGAACVWLGLAALVIIGANEGGASRRSRALQPAGP